MTLCTQRYMTFLSLTIRTIYRLIVCPSPQLTINMVKGDPQKNSSDCGRLCLAMAFELLSTKASYIAAYDSKRIRKHLSECLVKSRFSPFPVIDKRSTSDITVTDSMKIELHCMCRMPELPGDQIAECMREVSKPQRWFHKHCLDIPDGAFDSENNEKWVCETSNGK